LSIGGFRECLRSFEASFFLFDTLGSVFNGLRVDLI
jgi:hypothetical protein